MKARKIFTVLSTATVLGVTLISIKTPAVLWTFIFILPIVSLGLFDLFQTKHTIRRNFPVIGNIRYLLEKIRPEIMQYFVETDTEGRPIDRLHRNLIYERSKKTNDTTPFGTQLDVYSAGYEWIEHSIYAKNHHCLDCEPRVLVGGKDCLQPYSASILNISAMSFGSLSKNAVLAMNTGAKMGGFAHNTGEGGISPYHKGPGGDLIWQIGTGYFGCRTQDGNFNPERFKENATLENVKMIEIKISQGAKPGHGGILPASKNTVEIAAIRHIKPHTDVMSPPGHTAFSNPVELMSFIKKLRDLSGGKPIGFKICIGKKSEFIDICKAMIQTGIKPDFITIDGGEGGTGAAPVEFSNSVGMPLRDGLTFAIDTLIGYDLKKDIKVIASGKVFTSFHMARLIAVGADMINSARAMMMATGCIQALQCNRNTCPVGVATQNKDLMKGLVVKDKSQRVANYHKETIKSFLELLAASGLTEPSELKREHISRRVEMNEVLTYSQIYPDVSPGEYLKDKDDKHLYLVDQ
ncbi:FMN-binding glutamate synthase family protein [Wenyingzhuangia aestuarii]|uniref:FMN-binding glutamate synthase family protein n=1 Tax=Wenyingzhuangia aestuarii TaxID=1647582 RepID=UPI00143A10F2|nr:FMN-binding glutamate synthase family protein [Wenyingzhuangia aestuarii]NJB83341.1 glutamate synthase domain-containing protein 2 [Wenyingzhuangia aestuarii]